MDLKLKGKSWVGNICHRFESMCNEVDDFINKETVKYVENQVQNVGLGVKRFYSNVVQDILPPLENNVNSEEWSVTNKKVDHNSKMGIKGKPVSVHEKLPMQPGSVDTQINNTIFMPSKLDHSGKCATAPAADPCEETETDLPLEQDSDGIISNNLDKVVVETSNTMPLTASFSSESKIPSVTSSYSNGGDHNNTTQFMVSSLEPSVHKARVITFPKEGILSRGFSDDIECSSDVSSTGWEFEIDLPGIEDSNSDDDSILSVAPVSVDNKSQKDNVPELDSSSSSADDADCRASEKDRPLSDNLSTEVECFNASSSVQPSELDLPIVDDSNFDEDGSLSVSQAVSVDKGQMDSVRVMDSSSASDEDCRTSERIRPLSDNLSTEVEFFNASSTVKPPELDLPEAEDSNFDEDGSLSVPKAISVDKADDADCRTSEKDGSLYNNFSNVDECFNAPSSFQSAGIVVSTFSCEKEAADNGVTSSSCSASPESSNYSEFTFAELVQKAEDIFDPRVDCIYDKSNGHTCSVSFSTAACETKTPDFISAFSNSVYLLESNDINTSMIHGSVSVGEPSESRQDLCRDSHQSNLLISPAEIGNIYELGDSISVPNMATVDLSDKVERDESCAIVNAYSVYAAACRGRNFRYYKKFIKDAFGSRKRLIKEYEHLAILYGDVDKELWQHSESISSPSTPTAYSILPRSPSQDTPESDWELL